MIFMAMTVPWASHAGGQGHGIIQAKVFRGIPLWKGGPRAGPRFYCPKTPTWRCPRGYRPYCFGACCSLGSGCAPVA